jgi:hypothetical protein
MKPQISGDYIFLLSYAKRCDEKPFIKAILDRYDYRTLIGANLFVNNNPYNLEVFLHLRFKSRADEFESWLAENFPHKKRIYNYFITDIIDFMQKRGYNVLGLLYGEMFGFILDLALAHEANDLFNFPDEETIVNYMGGAKPIQSFTVFLSHSGKDKQIVDYVYNELQKAMIKVWYSKYQIDPGDSITDKINEGLKRSSIGVLFISKNFFDPNSGWPKAEMNFFLQDRLKTGRKNFICVNLDLKRDELPPLLQDYLYIDYSSADALPQLISAIEKAGTSS